MCAFVTTGIPCRRRTDLEHPVFERMWLWPRPQRLPRPLSGIICGIVYLPELLSQENRNRVSYLIETLDSAVKQIVRDPTHVNSVLDLIQRTFVIVMIDPL